MDNYDMNNIFKYLSHLRKEENEIRDFKKFLEKELERLRIEELNMLAQMRLKHIKKEKLEIEVQNSTEEEHVEDELAFDNSNNFAFEELSMPAQMPLRFNEKERNKIRVENLTEKEQIENMSMDYYSNDFQSPLLSENETNPQFSVPFDLNMFDFEDNGSVNLPDFI